MDDGIGVGERLRHVLRPGEIADDRAGAIERHVARPAQQDPQAISALRQFTQQMPADESRGAGQRDDGVTGCLRHDIAPGYAEPQTSRAVSTTRLSFSISRSIVMALPPMPLSKPHCGLSASWSSEV